MKYNEINKDVPVPLTIKASDSFKLGAYLWTNNNEKNGGLVIINPASSVRCSYYFRFADYLYEKGFNVITYDYRV